MQPCSIIPPSMKKEEKKEWTLTEFARIGGQALLRKYGREYYSKIAHKRWRQAKRRKRQLDNQEDKNAKE